MAYRWMGKDVTQPRVEGIDIRTKCPVCGEEHGFECSSITFKDGEIMVIWTHFCPKAGNFVNITKRYKLREVRPT